MEKNESKPIYNKIFLKTKRKSYGDEAAAFHNKEMPKAGSNHTCLAVTMIDSVLKKDENYYFQAFFKKCIRHTTDYLKISSNDSEESDKNKLKRDKFMCAKRFFKAKKK